MEEAEWVAPSPEVASLLNPVPAQRARLLLAQVDELVCGLLDAQPLGQGGGQQLARSGLAASAKTSSTSR